MRSGALMSELKAPRLGADEDFGFAWIFRFGPDGQGSSIPPDAHFELNQPGEGFLWVHLDIGDKRAQSWLGSRRSRKPRATCSRMSASTSTSNNPIASSVVRYSILF